MAKLLRAALKFSTVVAVLLLLSIFASRYIDPTKFPLLGLLSLGYPAVILLLLMCLIIWVALRSRWALLPLLPLLLTWSLHNDVAQVLPSSQSTGDYSLISYNAQLFGYYQFKKNRSIRDADFSLLDSLDADISCFQEFYNTGNPNGFQTLNILKTKYDTLYSHEKYTHEFVHSQKFGVVTLSRFPIIERGDVPMGSQASNFCIYSDIALPSDDTLRVFNAHLASMLFRAEDYGFMRGKFESWSEFKTGAQGVMNKLERANSERAAQIKSLMTEIEQSPYPVMLAGDFNAPAFSYSYRMASTKLNDAFCEKGFGIPGSYRGPFPSFRIDHIFHDDEVEINRYSLISGAKSDHRPVLVSFTLSHE